MQKKTSVYIEEFLNFLRNAQSEFSFSQEHQKEQEDLTQDILHCIELGELGYHDRAKMASYLKEAREERRQYKNRVEELACIVDFANINKKFINELEQLLGEVRKQERYHANRSYHPRVMTDEYMAKRSGGVKGRGKEKKDETKNHD